MDNEKNLPTPETRAPNIEKGSFGKGVEGFGSYSPELKVQPMPGERMVKANDAVSQAIGGVAPISQQPIGSAAADDSTATGQSPVIADDNDVIEKEWVDKAKTIVARTHGDPHAKSVQLTYLKKDYMQKRYGKLIKVPDDQRLSAQN